MNDTTTLDLPYPALVLINRLLVDEIKHRERSIVGLERRGPDHTPQRYRAIRRHRVALTEARAAIGLVSPVLHRAAADQLKGATP